MNKIATYQNRTVVWANYHELVDDKLPESDWLCLVTCNETKPEMDRFDRFARKAIKNNILEFKAHGEFGELLHDWFDETMATETLENNSETDVTTTWHNYEFLADTFWQCFFATSLPETTNYDNLTLVCTDLDGYDRSNELIDYLKRFEQGWMPDSE